MTWIIESEYGGSAVLEMTQACDQWLERSLGLVSSDERSLGQPVCAIKPITY